MSTHHANQPLDAHSEHSISPVSYLHACSVERLPPTWTDSGALSCSSTFNLTTTFVLHESTAIPSPFYQGPPWGTAYSLSTNISRHLSPSQRSWNMISADKWSQLAHHVVPGVSRCCLPFMICCGEFGSYLDQLRGRSGNLGSPLARRDALTSQFVHLWLASRHRMNGTKSVHTRIPQRHTAAGQDGFCSFPSMLRSSPLMDHGFRPAPGCNLDRDWIMGEGEEGGGPRRVAVFRATWDFRCNSCATLRCCPNVVPVPSTGSIRLEPRLEPDWEPE